LLVHDGVESTPEGVIRDARAWQHLFFDEAVKNRRDLQAVDLDACHVESKQDFWQNPKPR